MSSSTAKNNSSTVKSVQSISVPVAAGVKLNASAPQQVEHTITNKHSEMSINQQFKNTLAEDFTYPVAEHPLVAEGYLRVGDVLIINHPGGEDWNQMSGDFFVLTTHDGRLCFKNEQDGALCFTFNEFLSQVSLWCEAHDEEIDADGDDEENHTNSFKILVAEGTWMLAFCLSNKRSDGSLDHWSPSADFKEASILINEKAVRESPKVVVKAEKKRQPALGYDLAWLAADLNDGEEDTDKEFPLEFYILKRENIKMNFVLKHNDTDGWLLVVKQDFLHECFETLKEAFVWLNTVVRASHSLKPINASCVGTKIMLSFLKYKGTLVSKFISV